MIVEIKKNHPDAIIPQRGTDHSAGYDLATIDDLVIDPHSTVMAHTGLSVAIPEGYFGAIFARSGMAARESLRPANCVGVVDSDYRGEIMVAVHNDSNFERHVGRLNRIAQLVIMPYLAVEFKQVPVLDYTDRGEGGFGSTGR